MTITFFYPSRNVGGAQLLFLRIAEAMHFRGEHIKIVDFDDGFVPLQLARKSIPYELLRIPSRGQKIHLADDDVLALPLSGVQNALATFDQCSPKLLFWSIHPNNVNAWLPLRSAIRRIPHGFGRVILNTLFDGHFRKLSNTFSYLAASNAIVFMDYPNAQSAISMRLLNASQVKYLPIPITQIGAKSTGSEEKSPSDFFELGYIGRMDSDKINTAILAVDLARYLASSLSNTKFRLHLVGDGSANHRIRDYIRNQPFPIIHHGYMPFETLPEFICQEIDLGLGIGTAALEFGNTGKPTILLDWSRRRIKLADFSYVWLHETKHFTLQASFGGDSPEQNNANPIDSLLDIIPYPNKLSSIGNMAKAYVSSNHSMELVASSFYKFLNDTQADLRTLRNLLSR